MDRAGREGWIDALRLAAGLSMVCLHATADPNGQPWAAYSEAERVAPLLLRAVLYTARTELFIMISVFLLLMSLDVRPRGYRTVVAEQSRRLLLPFLFWTAFYAGFTLFKAAQFGYLDARLAEFANPVSLAGYVLLGDVKYHMHFIPTLFGVILFYPLFRAAERLPWLGVLVLLCLVVRRETDIVLWSRLYGEDILPWLLRAVKVITYCGYGIVVASFLGLWRRHREVLGDVVPTVAFAGGLLFLVKLAATAKTVETGEWPFDYVPGYWADFLMPVLLFALAMCSADRRWPVAVTRLAPYSFGLYLCHPIFLDLMEIVLRDTTWTPILQVGARIVVIVPATTLFVLLLSRIRALAWTIGLGPLPFAGLRARIPHRGDSHVA